MATEHKVAQGYFERPQPSEPLHFSQAAAQVTLEGCMRNAQHVRNYDGDQGVRRKEFSYPSQSANQIVKLNVGKKCSVVTSAIHRANCLRMRLGSLLP